MNSIDLKVTKSTMSISNIYTLNQGEYNVDKCVFDFTSDYDNLIKKAIFIYNNEEPIEMVILDNECNIPYELLQVASEFTLKVYAYEVKDEELVQRYSPTPLKIFLREGSYQGSNEVITPSQFEQYEAKLDEGLDDVADALDDVNEALQTMATATEETNRLNIDVSDKVNKDVTITLTKKDNTTKSVVVSDGADFQYNWDGTKLGVKTDEEESYSYVDLQGQQGPMGPQGEAFQIKKTYTTTQEMITDYDNMQVNDYVMISGSVEQQDNATLWVKTETEDPTYKWVYLADFSGASGIQGPTGATPNIQIGNVTSGDTPNVTRRGTDENPILDFTLVKGDTGNTGATGPTGNGIVGVEKTGTAGLVDTYTITYDNGDTDTFDVTNGADGSVTDVQVEGTSVVDNGVANITGLATQKELNLYKTIYNVLPKVNGEGESITLNNTANAVMKNKLYPTEMSQEGTPTPETPQPIHTISGDNTFNFVGKNRFDWRNPRTIQLVKSTSRVASEYSLSSITLQAGTYTLSFPDLVMANNNYPLAVELVGVVGGNVVVDKARTFTINEEKTLSYLYISINNNDNDNATATFSKIMIESGSSMTSYEPYQSQSKPLNLGELEYNAIGDYKDEFVKVDGKWYLKKTIDKKVLNGSENWNKSSSYQGSFYGAVLNTTGITIPFSQLYCNNFTQMEGSYIAGNYKQGTCFIENLNGTFDCWYDDGTATLQDFKNWLSTHNTIVYYQLSTPTDILLNDTLQEQIEDIYNQTLSYQGQTNISQVNNDLAFIVESSALRSMTDYGNSL